ncbi:MAG: TetR family transcriptional regulator, partial [Rhodoferax sp.]
MFCMMSETSAIHLRRLAAANLSERLTAPPRQQRGRDRQQALIEAGLQLTGTRDWADVTVGDIAAALGCSVGTFYT